MKHQKNREVTWTILELRGLLEDEDSHVHFARTIKHVALHPYHLNNIQRGLNQILRSLLNTYDRELKGFVLAFKNPKLLSNLGELFYDSPFIHVNIEADFYLFRPKTGFFLKDNTKQWLGESVEIGQEIRCCVTQLHHKSKPPFICASLKSDYSQGCRLSENIINIDMDSAIESTNNSMKIDIDGILENDGISEKKKKKQKKHRKKHKFQEQNSEVVCKIENESESNIESNISTIIESEKKRECILLNIGVDSATENTNNSTKTDIDRILENDDISEKEKKKQKKHRKKHKFQEQNSEVVCKIENESESNIESNTSTIIRSENKQECILLNIDVDSATKSTNNSMKIDIDGILENDSILEKQKKKQKKHRKEHKFQEQNSEVVCKIENESELNAESNTSTVIKSEKKQQCILLNIDVNSATESTNNSMKIDIDGILGNDDISEKEKKKQKIHRKEHKFQEQNSEVVCKIKNESKLNIGSNTSTIIKSEKEQQYILLNTDDSLNNLEVDNISKKHKKNKKISKSLLNNETILDELTESRKAAKRKNSILLDNITETKTKKEKKCEEI
ncbi:PREDICTED: probable DNA-directed RNA polymerase I subunit RPA43 isoform X2 [Trachymyrmex septentrionalis]|uniref:probable DNA-directed RNA polymerase I subunit RPA43 isoform X2 n=1 Tax=Trachymyrmex septentrionalis TaxID=34720 RepID=UPI00084F29B3|nr:PREDICTED: probable DNA-directed RNA polymerase I subunit RPA43 isoform X2 [Trachymyrmex septentrionalis]